MERQLQERVSEGISATSHHTNREHHNAMVRRVFEEHPSLIGSTTTVVIDAMHQVNDPNRDKTLQSHKGLHPETMRATASQLHDNQVEYLADSMVEWTSSFKGLDKPTQGTDLVVITVCKKDRHRSIAAIELIVQLLTLINKHLRCEILRRRSATLEISLYQNAVRAHGAATAGESQ